jgi:hypothetical protein
MPKCFYPVDSDESCIARSPRDFILADAEDDVLRVH